jgi:hypothetical protein
MNVRAFLFLFFLFLVTTAQAMAQAGITASPSKLFYYQPAGTTGVQKITVTNPNKNNLEVGVSLGDWYYDINGENKLTDPGTLKNSCTSWIKILPGSFFTLAPDERKELSIELNVPQDSNPDIPVHTAIVYVTQLNPGDLKTNNGASLKVSVRMGIKLYHSYNENNISNIEVIDFSDKLQTRKDKAGTKTMEISLLEMNLENTGKMWLEGKIKSELFNLATGEKTQLKERSFLSLPGDKRIIQQELPTTLKKGKYAVTAVINYGNKDELKIVELEFEH